MIIMWDKLFYIVRKDNFHNMRLAIRAPTFLFLDYLNDVFNLEDVKFHYWSFILNVFKKNFCFILCYCNKSRIYKIITLIAIVKIKEILDNNFFQLFLIYIGFKIS